MTLRSLRRTLAAFRASGRDPTTRLSDRSFVHATYTPDGPATLRLTWDADPAPIDQAGLAAAAWGPGAEWLLGQVDAMTGAADTGAALIDPPAIVGRAMRLAESTRIGASSNLYHLLLPTVIAQRITAGQAFQQWSRLCWQLGEPAPGPADVADRLRLPPSPESLRRPSWWFHRLGIEERRARTLTAVAAHASSYWAWGDRHVAASRLTAIPGVGAWTVGSVIGPAYGDPDAIPVGDFHFPNIVAWNLAGEPRGDDARMLELLAPFAGQRGRVLHALTRHGARPPAFGPRRRVLAIQDL